MSTVTEIDSTVEGAIKSVTVYRTGKAEIARTYEVKLAEGDNEIRISGLSSHIDQQSVRVSGLGLGARLADVTCTIKKNDPFNKPSKALQSLQAKKQRLEAEKLIRQQETEIYLSYAKSVNSEHVPTEQLVPFMHTLVQERQSVLHAITLLDEQIHVVDDAIAEHANNKRAGTIDGHIVLRVYVGSSLRAPASATVSDTQPDESAEPDEAWKKGVKDEIDAQFAPDIALLMDDKAKQIASSATVADQQRVEQEYDAHLMRYVSLANQRFEERLEAERSRRRSLKQKTGATTSFTLSYIVSKASWSPLYDIHATSQEKETRAPVTLSYRASITQETGETWADATLILSTASDATHSFQIPRLPTYRLQPGFAQGGLFAAHPPAQQAQAPAFTMRQQAPPSRFQFPPQRGGALFGAANPAMPAAQMQQNQMQQAQVQQAPTHADNTFSAFGTATVLPSQPLALYSQELAQAESTPVEEEEELEAPVAKLQTSPVSVSYTVSHPVNIPSDGAAHTVTIATLRLNAEITRVCVPRVDAVTYLQCIILNKSDYQLVAGPVNVFLEDMFVARTSIKDVMPNEGFDCTLGADRGLRVTYERLPGKEQSTDNAPMFGERKYVTKHVARTYITNNHPFRINNLIIRDALPLASSESARVLLRKPAGLADVGAGEKVHVADGIDVEWFRKGKGSKEPIEGKYKWLVSLDGGKGCTLETEWEVQSGSNTKWREVAGSNLNL